MKHTRSSFLPLLCALVMLVLAWPLSGAFGYNRTRTSLGVPTAWTQMPITYYIGKKGSKDVTDGSDIDAIKRSFATWASVDCAALTFRLGGLIDNPKGAYDPKGENQNHVYWVEPPEKWPFATDIVAVATVFYQPATGALRDTDLRFNGHNFRWSTSATPPQGFEDIQNTATHEIGHMLGLDHADAFDKDATMFNGTEPQETSKRDLAQDDRNGICAIYPKQAPDPITFQVTATSLGLTTCPSNKPLLPRLPGTLPGTPPTPPTKAPPGTSSQGSCSTLTTPAPFFFYALLVLMVLARLGKNPRQ